MNAAWGVGLSLGSKQRAGKHSRGGEETPSLGKDKTGGSRSDAADVHFSHVGPVDDVYSSKLASPKKAAPCGTQSSTVAVINLAKTTIGAGIMAMPKSMQLLGLLFGSTFIILLSSIIYFSLAILVQASQYTGQWTYKGAVKMLMGKTWAQVLQVVILMANAGGMTACLILTADILVGGDQGEDGGLFLMWGIRSAMPSTGETGALPEKNMIGQRWFVLIVIVIFFMLPLCMQQHMSSLQHSSIVGLALAGSFAAITVVLGLLAVSRGMVHEINIFPKLDCPPPVNILHLYHHHHHHPPPPPPTSMQKVEHLIDTLLQNPTSPSPAPPPSLIAHGVRNWFDESDDERRFITWRGFTETSDHNSGREDQEVSGGGSSLGEVVVGPHGTQHMVHFDGSQLTGLCKRHHFIALASDLIDASAVCLGAFVCHYSIHPIMNEMRDKASGTMLGVIATSNTAALAAYLATAWGGYLAFSNATCENLLKNFEVVELVKLVKSESISTALSMFVRVGYAVVMMTTYPLINFSFRTRMLELMDDLSGGAVPGRRNQSYKHRLILTLCTLGFTYVLAVRLPDIWVIMSFVGATGSTFMSFLMPAALALKMDPTGRHNRTIAGILLFLGATLVAGGVWNVLFMSD